MKRLFLICATCLVAFLFLAGCSGWGHDDDNVVPVTGTSLGKTSVNLLVGTTEQLTATIAPPNASNQNVTWSTDNSSVATVSSSGLVTAVSAGTATITVNTADGGFAGTCRVTVFGGEIPKAADRLIETQNNDGGWDWQNPDADPATGTPSPYNTLGVTAQGVLDAYKLTGEVKYRVTCINTYNALVANSTSTNPLIHKMRGADVTFLVELSEATGDSTYANFARTGYQATTTEFGGGTATGLSQYVRDVRLSQGWKTLIAWDINLYLQGALALNRYFPEQGFDADAAAMAEVIYDSLYVSPVDVVIADQTQSEYWLSITGALEAFTATGLHSAERDSLKASLLASQQADGHFVAVNGGDVQTTAYAVMALAKAGEKTAVGQAVGYLISTQKTDGGWIETDGMEYTESDSEAIVALVASLK